MYHLYSAKYRILQTSFNERNEHTTDIQVLKAPSLADILIFICLSLGRFSILKGSNLLQSIMKNSFTVEIYQCHVWYISTYGEPKFIHVKGQNFYNINYIHFSDYIKYLNIKHFRWQMHQCTVDIFHRICCVRYSCKTIYISNLIISSFALFRKKCVQQSQYNFGQLSTRKTNRL